MTTNKYIIKSRIWIDGEHGTFLAEGRITLLKEIVLCGSISAAAKSMKMSYKKAWEMVNAMNIAAQQPLVIRVSGGKGGGGTVVTDEGIKMIRLFEQLNQNCKQFLDNELIKIFG